MNDSQTVKKTVMLAGRVPPELKKRLAIACAHRDMKVQDALQLIVSEWLDREEPRIFGGASYKGAVSGATAMHDLKPGESSEVKRDRPKSSRRGRDAR